MCRFTCLRKYYASFLYLNNESELPLEIEKNNKKLEEKNGNFTQISGEFKYFLITNVPWIAKSFHASPKSELDDGCCDALFIYNQGRCPLLNILLNQESGSYFEEDGSLKKGVKEIMKLDRICKN